MEPWRRFISGIAKEIRDRVEEYKYTVDPEAPEKAEAFLETAQEGEYKRVKAGELPADQYFRVKTIRGVETLVFDPENIPDPVLKGAGDAFELTFEEENGFAVEERAGIAEAIKTEGEGGTLDEIYGRYQSRIAPRLLPVLKEALVLRIADRQEKLSRGRVYDWRGEIAANHSERGHDPEEAQHLISLCSTGYLDEGAFFEELYQENVIGGSFPVTEYKNLFDKYVRDNPFAVFVHADGMSSNEVYTLVEQKAREIEEYRYNPNYVDVCGKGIETHSVIEGVRERLEDRHRAKVVPSKRDDIDQYILRVYVDSLNI